MKMKQQVYSQQQDAGCTSIRRKRPRYEHRSIAFLGSSSVLQILLLVMVVVASIDLGMAQEIAPPATMIDDENDAMLSGNDNIPIDGTPFPTVLTSFPSDVASTTPTLSPTTSLIPTSSRPPTMRPTTTQEPSDSSQSSLFPTMYFAPSVSLTPSATPTDIPTITLSAPPTALPSLRPSTTQQPTASLQPSISPYPTTSNIPTIFPTLSAGPSQYPSDAPTPSPSVSVQPSNIPTVSSAPTTTFEPSSSPSWVPSKYPTTTPSANPTTSQPTDLPSTTPTNLPTMIPSPIPSAFPTHAPTLQTVDLTRAKITMVIEGSLEELTQTQQEEWENITTAHVFDYYEDLNDLVPGLVPVNVTHVQTNFKAQVLSHREASDRFYLAIEYSQTMTLGFYDPEEAQDSDLLDDLFVVPFENDAQEYLIALFEAWNLTEWLDLTIVLVGDTQAPTAAPDPPLDDNGFSLQAIWAISVSIVLAAIIVVGLLLWDRHKKEEYYRRIIAREQQNDLEFDNAGQPIDWRNPYTAANESSNVSGGGGGGGGGPTAQDAPVRTNSMSGSSRRDDPTSQSSLTLPSITAPPLSNSSRHSRPLSLPPLIPRTTSRVSSTSGGAYSNVPPQSTDNHRHTSITDTEITELTYSDGGGGVPSENDSDFGGGPALGLATISDEHYYEGEAPLSPLHFTDDDAIDDIDASASPPREAVLGLNNSINSPSMSGFDMQIQELE